jgi:hypothetical protein
VILSAVLRKCLVVQLSSVFGGLFMRGRMAAAGAAGMLMAAGAGGGPAAQAAATVPCSGAALAAAVGAAGAGATLSLARGCVYVLTAALPVVSQDLTITGNRATLERSYAPGRRRSPS